MKGTVLFVDDDPWLLQAIEALLSDSSFRALTTTDPLRTLPMIEWENVDVIDAIAGVFQDVGQKPPSWFSTISDRDEPEEPTGWFNMDPGEGFGQFEMNPRSRHYRGR